MISATCWVSRFCGLTIAQLRWADVLFASTVSIHNSPLDRDEFAAVSIPLADRSN